MAPEDNIHLEKYSSPDNQNANANSIIVVGVGGGGNNAVNHMFKQGIEHVSFVVVNTDQQALTTSSVPNKLLIGPNVTKGLGAGNKPEVAREAAEESAAEIANLFDENIDVVFVTAGMGGGTGTGAAPVVARIAKEKGLLTIGIVTIPFMFEGMKKIQKAIIGADEMSKFVDAIMIVNNERLIEIYHDLEFATAFAKADDILSTAASSIAEIITRKGYINLDFNDVNTTLRDGGTAIISVGYGEGENRVTKAIEDALHSPLLKNTDVLSSKRILFNLYYSRTANNKFSISEFRELNDFINSVEDDVDVIWGITYDESLGDKVKFTILAAGFEVTINEEKGKKIVLPTGSDSSSDQAIDTVKVASYYGSEAVASTIGKRATRDYIVLTPEQLDDDAAIDNFEKSPTFSRNKRSIATPTAAKNETPNTPTTSSNNIINFDEDE